MELLTLLFPPAAFLAVLAILHALYGWLTKTPRKTEVETQPKKKRRPQKRALEHSTSHFDTGGNFVESWKTSSGRSTIEQSSYAGFFNLLFILVLIWFVSTVSLNIMDHEHPLLDEGAFLARIVYGLPELMAVVGASYGLFWLGFLYQKLVVWGILQSEMARISTQVLMEGGLFFGAVLYALSPQAQRWPFSQKAGLLMEAAVLFMKLHSYISTNRALEERALRSRLSRSGPAKSSEPANRHGRRSSRRLRQRRVSGNAQEGEKPEFSPLSSSSSQEEEEDHHEARTEKRTSRRATTSWCGRLKEKDNAWAGRGGDHLYALPVDENAPVLKQHEYPNNVSAWDYFVFSFMPALVYEPLYPRTDRFRLGYFLEKSIFGISLFSIGMTMLTQYVTPIMAQMPDRISPVRALISLIPPVTLFLLLVFFLVFECICNAFAELTYLGDRKFYEDWWNCTSFTEFSRKWNLPVHEFLLRHCFLALQDSGFSTTMARYCTFGISIILHEFIIVGIFGWVNPWLLIFSCAQFPLMSIMRSAIFKGKRLGNLVFWLGIILGTSLIMVLYMHEYCTKNPRECREVDDSKA